ncbi:MAG: hypothetical protein VB130_14705 [Clostridium sp.]|nr:hypothetical protein [Clostridium sp.]
MKENKLLLICTLILSISIIVGSVLIGSSICKGNKDTNVNQDSYSLTYSKALMTEKETAEYLNMPQDKFISLITYEESQMKKMNSYDTYSFIPFVRIDGVRYFNREQVGKWVEYNITNRREINTN